MPNNSYIQLYFISNAKKKKKFFKTRTMIYMIKYIIIVINI